MIKSQGHCQKHGAKAKRCKIDGCNKQAQGTHDGMCKRHYNLLHPPVESSSSSSHPVRNTTKKGKVTTSTIPSQPPPPEGESVYDRILPLSLSYKPITHNLPMTPTDHSSTTTSTPTTSALPAMKEDSSDRLATSDPTHNNNNNNTNHDTNTTNSNNDRTTTTTFPEDMPIMPLVTYLAEGRSTQEPGWHRTTERRARGMFLVDHLATPLEPWERQLVRTVWTSRFVWLWLLAERLYRLTRWMDSILVFVLL